MSKHLSVFTYPQVVKFKHWTCLVQRSFYTHGGVPALCLIADRTQENGEVREGDAIATATVNLPELITLGHVWIKSWEENEGMAECLIAAGIIGPELERVPTGFVHATVHQLLEPTKST